MADRFLYFPPQSLPPSEEDQTLAIKGDCEEVLKEQCPPELTDVQEKDVRTLAAAILVRLGSILAVWQLEL